MQKVYLDYSATTPVRPEVAELVIYYMTAGFGNPSSMHSMGREVREAVKKARNQVAHLINAAEDEIYFTSGGTEADNLAIRGVANKYAPKGRHIITSAVEHSAVLDTCRDLQSEGFRVTYLPVDEFGIVNLDYLEKALSADTILISVMHVNNEVGTIQPLEEISLLARKYGALFHTDAVQSLGKLPLDVEKIGIDLLSGSGHKIYAPKGTGFLYVKKEVQLKPLLFGGGQEKKLRPGTENTAGIIGLGLAAELAQEELPKESCRLRELSDSLIKGIIEKIPEVRLNGHPMQRVCNNVSLSFKDCETEAILLLLDINGIAASGKSACASGRAGVSHVLEEMKIPSNMAQGTIRMTLGRNTTKNDINYVVSVLPDIINKMRKISPFYSTN